MAGDEGSIAGGKNRQVQGRKIRHDGWTAERRRAFLDRLASCCNVTHSVAAAGLSMGSAYYLRARDPQFAADWDEALAAGYLTLESLLIDRAAGPRQPYRPGDMPLPDPREMDKELALNLLRLRTSICRTGAGQGRPKRRGVGADELATAILDKLDVLNRRKQALAAGQGQKRRPK